MNGLFDDDEPPGISIYQQLDRQAQETWASAARIGERIAAAELGSKRARLRRIARLLLWRRS